VAQVWSAQATTFPLIVNPVTVRLTVTDCALPTAEPVLSVAVMLIVPVYEPGWMFVAEAFTPKAMPAPLSVPDVVISVIHGTLDEACQVTGRAQVPLSLSATFRGVEVACPWVSEKARVAGDGVDSTHGGRTVSATVKVCVLPCTLTELESLATMVTVVLYLPAARPEILTPTPMLPDCPAPPIVPLDVVCANQGAAGAALVFHDSGHTQLPVPVNMTVCAARLVDAPCTALKERALDEGGDRVQGG